MPENKLLIEVNSPYLPIHSGINTPAYIGEVANVIAGPLGYQLWRCCQFHCRIDFICIIRFKLGDWICYPVVILNNLWLLGDFSSDVAWSLIVCVYLLQLLGKYYTVSGCLSSCSFWFYLVLYHTVSGCVLFLTYSLWLCGIWLL